MKSNLLRSAALIGLALIGGKALLWLVSPPFALSPAPIVVVHHSWQVAKMGRRIYPGMGNSQVHRLLGGPSEEDFEAVPGDIPNLVDGREGYSAQDGSLFVYYRMSPHGEVVAYTSRERESFDGTAT